MSLGRGNLVSVRPIDTDPEVRRRQVAFYRGLSPEERVDAAVEIAELARSTTLAGITARHPELDDDGVKAELLVIMHGGLGRTAAGVALGR